MRKVLRLYAGDFIDTLGYLGGVALCRAVLEMFVILPKDTQKIVLVGHKRPGRDRFKIEVADDVFKLVIDGEVTLMYATTAQASIQWIDKGFKYVSIEY